MHIGQRDGLLIVIAHNGNGPEIKQFYIALDLSNKEHALHWDLQRLTASEMDGYMTADSSGNMADDGIVYFFLFVTGEDVDFFVEAEDLLKVGRDFYFVEGLGFGEVFEV
jgi:hypothetical protein